ncbi:MAG: hypothetical protein M5U32_11665 [Myxococcota bacterium]|nr:hypothetical protein [Myxococcota bacterium]
MRSSSGVPASEQDTQGGVAGQPRARLHGALPTFLVINGRATLTMLDAGIGPK